MIVEFLKRLIDPPVCLRPARISDVASLTKSHGLSWQVTYRGHMPDYALDNLPLKRWKQSWKAYIQEGKDVLVVAKGRFIIGFVNFGPSRDDDLDASRIGELYGVYLHPDHWRHGYGRRMCEAAIDKLKERGYSEVTLWVFKQNSAARRFYKRLGFTKMHGKRVQERYPGWIIEQTRYRMKL